MKSLKRLLAISLLVLMIIPLAGIETFAKTANVVYDSNNGTGEIIKTTVREGESYGENITEPKREDMVFTGWATSPENAEKGVLVTSCKDGEEATNTLPRATAGETIRLYAAYAYTVTLNCGNQGWQNANITLYKYEGTNLALYHTKSTVLSNYYMLPGISGNVTDQRSFIEWNTSQNALGKGIGTAYTSVYDKNANVTLKAIWGYPIRYNADGGIFPSNGTSIFQKYVCGYNGSNYEDPLTLYGNFDFPEGSNLPTKAGCRLKKMNDGSMFYGLFTSAGTFFTTETAKQNLTIPPTGGSLSWSSFHTTTTENGDTTVEFFAIWEPSVTYKANGASGSDVVEWLTYELNGKKLHQYNNYTIMSSSRAKNTFSFNGATFKGWNTKPDGKGVYYAPGSIINQLDSSDPIVLYAQWDVPAPPVTYTVSYDANGGSGAPSAQTKEKGTAILLSEVCPVREGYIFTGWTTAKTASVVFYRPGDTYSADSDVTLYAVWEKEQTEFTLTFNANGGSGAPSAMTKTKGVALTIPAISPTKTGYKFLGWSENKGATVAEYTFFSKFEKDEDTILYAVWKLEKTDGYVITYDANGGISAPLAEAVTPGATYTITSEIANYPTYNFIGWATTADGPVVYGINETITPTGDMTLYAKWTESAHGSLRSFFSTASVVLYSQASTVSSVLGAVPANNILNAINISGNFAYGNNTYNSTTGWYMINDGKSKEIIAVILNTDGGTFSGDTTFLRTLNDGATFRLPTEIPQRGTDTFLGWSADKNATVPTYKAGDIYAGSVYVTLYAIYKVDPTAKYTITFNSDNGTYFAPVTGSGTITLPTTKPTKSGYAFVGWTSDGGNTYYKAGASYELTKNVTLKAIYTKGTFVYYSSNGGSWGTTDSKLIPSPTKYGVLNDQDFYYWPEETATLTRPGYRMHTSKAYLNIPRFYSGDGKGNGIGATASNNNYFGYDLWPYNASELSGGGHDANTFQMYGLGLSAGAELTFYACWDPIITYNMNYNGGAVVQDFNYITEGNSYKILALGGSTMYAQNQASTNLEGYTGATKIPKRSGYTFKGWNTKADGTGKTYNAGSTYNVTEPLTLYAMWKGHTHSYSLINTVNATCTANGYKEYKCSSCGNTYRETLYRIDHNYNKVVTEPTCNDNGYTTYTCTMCKTSYTADEKPNLGHDYKATVTEPTCTEGGYTTYQCSRCESNYTADETPELGHLLGEWYTVTEATTTQTGTKRRDCTRCDYYEEDIIPKKDPEISTDIKVYSENYYAVVEGADTVSIIRFAEGIYETGNEIKKAPDIISYSQTKIASMTKDGKIYIPCPKESTYSVWMRTENGDFMFHVTTDNFTPVLSVSGITMTLDNVNSSMATVFFANGIRNTYREVKNNILFTASSAKLTDVKSFKYTVDSKCIDDNGHADLTVCIRDAEGKDTFLYTEVNINAPAVSQDGLNITLTNLSGIKCIKRSFGTYNTATEIKASQGVITYGASVTGGTDSAVLHIPHEGELTVMVQYKNGYAKLFHLTIVQKRPSFAQNGNSVTFGNLDDLYVIRYAKGTFTKPNAIKAAPGSRLKRSGDIVNGEITISDLEPGDYTFLVQYNEESQNVYYITVK